MADNTILDSGSGGDTIRTVDRAGKKSQVVGLDIGIGGVTEILMTPGQKTMANSIGVVMASDQAAIPVTGTFYQATQPVSGTFFQATQPVSIAATVAVSGTFWQATQPISAASLPLPSGAATSANQTTCNTSVASIDTKTPVLGQALAASSVPVVLTAAQLVTLTPPAAPTTISLVPATSGGPTVSRVKAASGTNATNLKASAGQVYGFSLDNNTASARWVHFYNSASAPTAGSGTPYFSVLVPPSSGRNVPFDCGIPFGTGIGYTITTGASDTDTGSCSADDVHGFILWK